MLLQKFIAMENTAPRDEKMNETLTFFSSFNSTASFHVDPTGINLGSLGPTPLRSNIPDPVASSVYPEESFLSAFQEEEDTDSLWSLLREDIIEIKGKST
jgi:hypothetical protein